MLFNPAGFVWWTFAMFSRLIDDRSRQQFRRVELADREPLEPRLLAARVALELRTSDVPELDVDAIGAALAEEENSHEQPVYDQSEQKAKHVAGGPVLRLRVAMTNVSSLFRVACD
jgi:hypothetical protein